MLFAAARRHRLLAAGTPAGLPLAVVAVDTLMWHRASPEVLGYLSGEPELRQLLAHALVYRLVTEVVRHTGTAGVDAAARPHSRSPI